jgi:hypothetical protein
VEVPSVAVPSLKVMVPVGVPLPEVGLTVAVKVTEFPEVDGFRDDVTVVVVFVEVGPHPVMGRDKNNINAANTNNHFFILVLLCFFNNPMDRVPRSCSCLTF